MVFLSKFIVKILFTIQLLCSLVLGIASFTNPPGSNNSTVLTIGEDYIVEWTGSGAGNSDYTELSLGIVSLQNDNIFWLLSNVFGYAGQNYPYTVALGNGLTVNDGVYYFILVNGTDFGEQAFSSKFQLRNATKTSSAPSSTAPTTSTTAPTTSAATPSSASANSTPSSSGLSTGAQAGIGVGVALAVLALLGVALLFWRRRSNAAANKIHEVPDDQISSNTPYKDVPSSSLGIQGFPDTQQLQQYVEAPDSQMAQVHEAPAPVQVIHEAP